MYGYSGKILRVNLTEKKIIEEPITMDFARNYVGGQGFGAKILYSELPAGTNCFAPENKIIFAVGPFEGTSLPGSARTCIVSKSPLTGYLGDTDFGGYWGRKFKMAGYDCLVIEGKSDNPVYINIENDKVEIKDAKEIWGKSILDADRYLKGINTLSSTLLIGEAGENLVRYACVISDLRYVAGRSGIGAVMGSKNLKGIVVYGNKKIKIYNADKLEELRNKLVHDLINDGSCATLSRFGTWNSTAGLNINGVIPTKNFQMSTFALVDNIDGEAMEEKIQVAQKTCFACPIACRNVVRLYPEEKESSAYGGPQYEAVAALGSLLLIGDPYAIARLNMLCNHLGLDAISAGVSVAFLLECLDREILTYKDLGFKVSWGDEQGITRVLESIARKKGIGKLLAEGVKRAAEKVGHDAENFAIHVKGMEVAMHDPRGKKGQGLSYATSHKGADHMESMHDEAFQGENVLPALGFTEPIDRRTLKGKAKLVKLTQDYWGTMADCLVTCKFFMTPPRPLTPERVISSLNYITGWNISLDDYMEIGERVFNLCRIFNLREGMEPLKEDRLPKRFSEVLLEGGSKGESISADEFANELVEYYKLRGWNQGVPTKDTLIRLGLI